MSVGATASVVRTSNPTSDKWRVSGLVRRRLVKGNEALALGAVAGGAECFFGYPITPQNEIPAILSGLMLKLGRVFLQAESEIAVINMVYGASATGHRALASSSSPGISLMMAGLSYIAGARLLRVIINVMRSGPGAPRHNPFIETATLQKGACRHAWMKGTRPATGWPRTVKHRTLNT